MVQCACGKTIDKVPNWLMGVKVEFVCNNCPNRQIKSITQLTPEQITGAAPRNEVDEVKALESFEEEEELEV